MMFLSKKTDLPARPQPPTWEQMEEDLKLAKKCDVVFALSVALTGSQDILLETQRRNSADVGELSEASEGSQQLFFQAVEFVEKNDELMTNLELLKEKRTDLQNVSRNLKVTVENVKRQALGAIGRH